MVGLTLGGRNRALALACFAAVLIANSALAQFSTIINSPPTVVGDGLQLGSNTQLNLYEGGRIGTHFRAGQYRVPSTNIEVNITGGSVGDNFQVFVGSRVAISGGFFEGTFGAYTGSQVIVSGGSFGDDFHVHQQSRVTLSGGDFRLDGVPIEGLHASGDTLSLDVPERALITGVFADGTPFAFHSRDGDFGLDSPYGDIFADGTLTLELSALPDVGPAIISASTDAVPLGIREGQTLVVDSGATVADNFNAGMGSTVRIQEGGTIGDNLEAVGAHVVISGGSVGQGFDAFVGSRVDISGGSVGGRIDTFAGSELRISGGSLGDQITAREGSRVTIAGAAFEVDGVPVEGLPSASATKPLEVPYGALFTGILADGTPFLFSTANGDEFQTGTLMLEPHSVPPIEVSQIRASTDRVPLGLRQGQTLTVDAGGYVPDHFTAARGSTITIEEGGVVGDRLEAIGAEIHVTGGSVGTHVVAFDGTQVTVSGGSVGAFMRARDGSNVRITGGSVGSHFYVDRGSHVAISGGTLGDTIYGYGPVVLSGGDFRINGDPIEGLTDVGETKQVDLPDGALFTGVLADGTPFAFPTSYRNDINDFIFRGDYFARGMLTLESASLPPIGPSLITAPADPVPLGIRDGQTLVVEASGVVGDNFVAGRGSRVRVREEGTVGGNFEAVAADVVISGGFVGSGFDAFDSRVLLESGTVADAFEAHDGSDVVIRSGSIGQSSVAYSGSRITMYGGGLGATFEAYSGSQVTISGGTVGNNFDAHAGSSIHLVGTRFWLDGTEVSDVVAGVPLVIGERDRTLTGILADGTEFSFDLNSMDGPIDDHLSPDATLTVTLISLLAGDYDSDGLVEQGDLDLVLLNWGKDVTNPISLGWINDLPSGIIDQQELDRVLLNWGRSAPLLTAAHTVPEPEGRWLACVVAFVVVISGSWRAWASSRRAGRVRGAAEGAEWSSCRAE